MNEPSSRADDRARQVIGAAIEVHRHLGPGFIESMYQRAMDVELALRGIPFQREAPITVAYKGRNIGAGNVDFLIDECLVVELKALEALHPIHEAQVISYLRSTGKELGLLINFNIPLLKNGIKRIVLTNSQ